MIVEVRVNELPESVQDGTLVVWHLSLIHI